ncbi:MAG: DNA polymerase III subunit delta' [Acidiferrobacterales bacterium]
MIDPPLLYPWTRAQARHLMQNVERLPHALLVTGPRGLGKVAFAAQIAHLLLCADPDGTALSSCGKCQNCRLLAAGNHPDMHWVVLLEEHKVIGVDQIRALAEFLQLRPHIGRLKIVIISPAEAMNINAANSLLKILEEPPADSLLMLVSSDTARLPATVRSRCHRIAIAAPDRPAALDWLLAGEGFASGQAEAVLDLAHGAPLLALELARDGFLAIRGELLADIEALGAQAADPVSCAARWKSHGARRCLEWLEGGIMDLIKINMASPGEGLVNYDSRERLHVLQKRLNLKQLIRFLETVSEGRNLLGGQLDELLLLEDVLIRWTRLAQHT